MKYLVVLVRRLLELFPSGERLPNLLCGTQGGTAREASYVLAASEDPGAGQGKVLPMPLRLHLDTVAKAAVEQS